MTEIAFGIQTERSTKSLVLGSGPTLRQAMRRGTAQAWREALAALDTHPGDRSYRQRLCMEFVHRSDPVNWHRAALKRIAQLDEAVAAHRGSRR